MSTNLVNADIATRIVRAKKSGDVRYHYFKAEEWRRAKFKTGLKPLCGAFLLYGSWKIVEGRDGPCHACHAEATRTPTLVVKP